MEGLIKWGAMLLNKVWSGFLPPVQKLQPPIKQQDWAPLFSQQQFQKQEAAKALSLLVVL